MKIFSKDGVEMIDISSIALVENRIVIKGKMMKSMATTLHVEPKSVWEAFRLFPLKLLVRLPILLFMGFRINAKEKKKSTTG
ncbi:hypothetical protein EWE75_14855 [Sphingomonas populi]|uniref:Uncharacterized protein n=1 Tax=Sphingomonas populi TaxID=2484750 RepID=A0A4Q6XSY5_9SPHN|nr:hypothetical protein [Sphingomonas populi]RZF63613.1 hypothetical protein EWE75_14855 [Sphingomonas populi]